jgi:hypothetical protein
MTKTIRLGLVVAAVIIGLAATAVSAQQGPPGPAAGHPRAGGVTPQPPTQCYPLIPASCVPVLVNGSGPMSPGWCPAPVAAPLDRPEPALRVGYLCKDHGAEIKLSMSGGEQRVVSSTRNDSELQGVWGELVLPLVLTYRTEFVLTVGHLFPVQTNTLQTYSLIGNPGAKREWHPDVRWWEVDAAWLYRFGMSVSGIVGFRWSSYIAQFDRAKDGQGFLSSGDGARFCANAYIPVVGLQWEHGSRYGRCAKASVIGSPVLPGDFEYSETATLASQPVMTRFAPSGNYQSGYFFEASGEYSVHRAEWSFGAFVRFNAIHSERTRSIDLNQVDSQADMSFDRSNWILGGKIGFMM